MTKRYEDDDDATIKDGNGITVKMWMLDSTQREVATHYSRKVRIVDAFGAPSSHQPGYRFADTSSDDPRIAAYETGRRRMTDAWCMRDVGPAALRSHATALHGVATELQARLDEEVANEEMAREMRWRHEDGLSAADTAWEAARLRAANAWRPAR